MFKVKNKLSYFGLEFDHDAVPNAIVISSTRPQKIIKWVNSYKPIVSTREDGKEVRRERTAVQCPMNFRLRKDEIQDAMKRNKTENYQDGKFFVILDHRMGQFEHPDTVKMKQAELRKKVADDKLTKANAEPPSIEPTVEKVSGDQVVVPSDQPRTVGVGTPDSNPVGVQDGPIPDSGGVTSVTESGLEVTDRRCGAGDQDSEKPSV